MFTIYKNNKIKNRKTTNSYKNIKLIINDLDALPFNKTFIVFICLKKIHVKFFYK